MIATYICCRFGKSKYTMARHVAQLGQSVRETMVGLDSYCERFRLGPVIFTLSRESEATLGQWDEPREERGSTYCERPADASFSGVDTFFSGN